jgi:putative tricarboxylic transport membrane protein
MASDRILGLVLLVVAAGYTFAATQVQTSFLIDPVGPKTVPVLVGTLVMVCAALMILKPEPDPDWPEAQGFLRLGAATAVLVGYALSLKEFGFLIPTALASGVLAWQISPKTGWAAVTGLALSAGLYLLFRYGLGLGLRPWPGGLPG